MNWVMGAAAALGTAMIAGGPAQAATVRVINNEGTIARVALTGAPGEANNVSILGYLGVNQVLLTDLGAHPLSASSGCTGAGLLAAICTTEAGLAPGISINTGDGDDAVDATNAQPGHSYGGDHTYGLGTGDDSWKGGAASATVTPGAGDDTVTAGAGGAWVIYHDSAHAGGAVIDLEGYSGTGSERDVLRGVTAVSTGPGDDTFAGGPLGERYSTGGGTDHVRGRGGDDALWIRTGSAAGDAGNDQLLAQGAGATLDGGAGDDDLYLSATNVTAICGDGDDTVSLMGPLSNVPASIAADCETVNDHRY